MAVVSFTRMADGTREDYELLAALEERFNEGLADRLLAAVESLPLEFFAPMVRRVFERPRYVVVGG